jgi:hypothetical protein
VLTSVNLSNLTSVGGYLSVDSNYSITNLDGLSGIITVGGGLEIDSNHSLTNLSGLSGIATSVGTAIEIYNNDSLTNLNGLSGITTIEEEVVCQLLGQLIPAPATVDVHDNLDDSCTPVPSNCP